MSGSGFASLTALFLVVTIVVPDHPVNAGGRGSGATHTPAGQNRVDICHVPPGKPWSAHTAQVAQAAVSGHLAHGDALGECSLPCCPTSPVRRTGQTECRDVAGSPIDCTGTGQDGEYQLGASVEPRFTDNGDGTATDNLTELIWLKNADCFGVLTWAQGLAQANDLADGSCGLSDGSVAGDWRLPNVRELLSLIDYGQVNPALPLSHPFLNVQTSLDNPDWSAEVYWTSTSEINSPLVVARSVDLFDGLVYVGWKQRPDNYVWPVRGGEQARKPVPAHIAHGDAVGECSSECTGPVSPVAKTGQADCWDVFSAVDCAGTGQDGEYQLGASLEPRFTHNRDGTATDNLTGLIWLKDANCFGVLTWAQALSQANDLADGSCGLRDGSVAGDWRLPNIKELHSLIDYGQVAPALPPGHPFSIDTSSHGRFWSSTNDEDFPWSGGSAWWVDFIYGDTFGGYKPEPLYFLPVRGGE